MSGVIIALVLGFLLDLLFGDPRWLYHPVCLIGKVIDFFEPKLRKRFAQGEKEEKKAGILLVVIIGTLSTIIPFLILLVAYRIHIILGVLLQSFWCYQLLATKSLKQESMKVYQELEKSNLEGARKAVSMIVGRDTKDLSLEGVTKATVETIAENTSDGVIAPLFYMAIGGAPLLFLYKAINTMDSMVGYKNDKYLYFGRCAAKVDDVVNYIPSRLAAWLLIAASALLGLDSVQARKIYKRDRRNHASPNSAQTESVVAGALGIQLAGDAYYFGKLYRKQSIGDKTREITYQDIKKTNDLLYVSATLAVVIITVGMLAFTFPY